MKTPIVDFVRAYSSRDVARFHMPGHKGKGMLGVERLDITEVQGADVLYAPEGVIAESEENATALFGSAHTFYSTEGSTLAIKAMLALVAANTPKGERPLVLAARNVHKAFLYGVALLDMEVAWLYPETHTHLCACPVTGEMVKNALSRLSRKPCAVYLTSPDYLGNVADISAVGAVCKAENIPLLVDNAHGAYLKFLTPSRHPIDLGATMTADSAHKTLPVLTGGAYLHIAKDAPKAFVERARHALSLFASTSPSYLILQSLDYANHLLAAELPEAWPVAFARVAGVKQVLSEVGYTVMETEPLKVVVDAAPRGYTGEGLAEALRAGGVEPEMADDRFLVLMCTPQNGEEDYLRVLEALVALPPRAPRAVTELPVSKPTVACTVREALLGEAEVIPVSQALGRVLSAPTVSCPPAVPIVMSGEVIDGQVQALLHAYGATQVCVLKQ